MHARILYVVFANYKPYFLSLVFVLYCMRKIWVFLLIFGGQNRPTVYVAGEKNVIYELHTRTGARRTQFAVQSEAQISCLAISTSSRGEQFLIALLSSK